MKNRTALFIISAGLLAIIALVFVMPHTMISPGKVIKAHAEFGDDCFACHTPMFGSSAEKCIDCHKVADIGIRTTKGIKITGEKKKVAFHQKLLREDCVACHSDHIGVKAFRPESQFSHKLLQAGVQKQCDSCHRKPKDSLHRKIQGNCVQCHTQKAWTPATFKHEKYFRLDRDHDVRCATCHVNNDYAHYTCYGCHEHTRSNVREEHIEEGIRDYKSCVKCHRSADEDDAKRIWRRMKKGDDD